MIGLPKKGPQSYDLTVKYALRITNSGEFLHSAPWNTPYFGRLNASHGCVGMSVADAGWLYANALPGSPVTVTGTNRGLEPLNGLTDWNADFKTYSQGSAL
jgi:lipoprotein-anchoring transpeptidase ErfK/SrfK